MNNPSKTWDDSLDTYLSNIEEVPPLTREDEARLSQEIQQGNADAKKQLVEPNLRLVHSIAKKYVDSGISPVELIKAGNIGLFKAAEKFESEQGFRFSTYAEWWINKEIADSTSKQTETNTTDGMKVFLSPNAAETFAKLEENKQHIQVANIIERAVLEALKDTTNPLHIAELGGGAHTDRYDRLFLKLSEDPKSQIDWVDMSPFVLTLAKKYTSNDSYQDRLEVIRFIEQDMLEYLVSQPDQSLDLINMKYTIDYVTDLSRLFSLAVQKLKPQRALVATLGMLNPELKSFSTSGRYFYNGQPIPEGETRTLKDGDVFTIKFFRANGDPASGHIDGVETTRCYHSPETFKSLAKAAGLEVFLGDWKEYVPLSHQEGDTKDQAILVMMRPA